MCKNNAALNLSSLCAIVAYKTFWNDYACRQAVMM